MLHEEHLMHLWPQKWTGPRNKRRTTQDLTAAPKGFATTLFFSTSI